MQTFDEYWAGAYTSVGMPGIFDLAMREIALKSWNAAIGSASHIAEQYADQYADHMLMDKIGELVA